MNLVSQSSSKGLQDPKYFYKDDFTYQAALSAALAPAASASDTFNIDGDSDFFLVKTTVFALVASDGTLYNAGELPAVTVVITDTTSGRSLMAEPIPLANLAGTAQLPFIWPILRLFAAKSTIKVDFANVSDNKTYSALYLSFHGIKAFFKAP